MANLNLKLASYTITANSKLEGKLFAGKKVQISSIVGPYRKGTFNTDNVPTNGSINIKYDSSGLVEFTYVPKADFIGEDSFEYELVFSDGDKAHQVVDILVKERRTKNSVIEKYIDIFADNISQNEIIKTIKSSYANTLDIPTSLSYSITNKSFTVVHNSSHHDFVNSSGVMINGSTKTKYCTFTNVVEVDNKSNGTTIRALPKVRIEITKDNDYFGTEYGIVKFKDFVNKEHGHTLDIQEYLYINLKLRPYDHESNDNEDNLNVPDFDELPIPDFVYPDVEYPDAPTQITEIDKGVLTGGDLLAGTLAHKEFDIRGNNTIRVGKKVPANAVNLAYYYNTTASMDDTVSVIETDMNVVSLHYAEEWIHKRDLDKKDENLFPDYIEFEGEEGTDLEGYWGILYREYVMWEDKTIKDLDPKNIVVYQEYRGLREDSRRNLPIFYNYGNGERQGELELTHTIIDPMDFNKNKTPKLYVAYCKYEGITTKTEIKYHGSAKYGGVVTKKDGMANIDPDQPSEVMMFPDDTGLLYKDNGDTLLDDELFFITDVFKDGTPLYFKHKLKYRIYDSIGPDQYGVYKSHNVKLVMENHHELNEEKYKYKVIVKPTKWNNIYDAYIYTSFVPTTDLPIYIIYDGMPEEAYKSTEQINPANAKIGEIEKLSVYEAIHKDDYTVDKQSSITKQSTITMNDIQIIQDERQGIPIEYMIMADGMESPIFKCEVMNYKYAISTEKDRFINEEMIVSPKSNFGYMTAKDMFVSVATKEQVDAITDSTIFRLRFNNRNHNTFINKEKVIMYTDPSGGGLIMARTYLDTGLADKSGDSEEVPKFNKNVTDDHIYKVEDGKIYKGYSVMCRNIRSITLHPPIDSNPLKSWLPAINYSYFSKAYERIDKTVQIIYSVPEFCNQVYGRYGRPYVDVIGETPKHLGNGAVKVSRYPIYIEPSDGWVPKNIVAKKVLPNGKKRMLTVKNFNFKYGIIEFEDKISDNDKIEIDYTYEENYYHYRGYYENGDPTNKMIDISLNPNMYNSYTDNSNEVFDRQNVYNLFNRTIYFFLKPMRVIDKSNGEIIEDNHFTLYHRIDKPDAISPFDLHIGRIFIRHHSSLKSTKIIDTRRRGGGVLESMSDEIRRELEPESDFYLDIGTLDGSPYHENSTVVIKIDQTLLGRYGGRYSEKEIEDAVRRWSAYGMLPIIEYVKVLQDDELPQTSLEVETVIESKMSYRPYIEAHIIDGD